MAVVVAGPPVLEISFVYIASLLYLALVGSTLAFSLYFTILRRIGPSQAAYTSLLIPIVAMLLSTVFEGYRWSLAAILGVTLALGGLFIALKERRR